MVDGIEGPAPESERTPQPFDPDELSSARVYDYLLGGKDNFEIDRETACQMLSRAPELKVLVWFVRSFTLKAVERAAAAGIRQFLDLGSGIPASPNVHEVARKIEPSARVVYVDYDPLVVAHCDALLAGPPGVAALLGDVRRPRDIIDQLSERALIDFNEPVAITLSAVLHYVMDDEHPADIIAAFRDRLAPGSYLAIVHGSSDSAPEILQVLAGTNNTSAQVTFRSPAQTEAFLAGFELFEPGVAPVQEWLGPDLPDTSMVMLGAIGRKP
ncbi:SAM-dependent methyltransferase [Nocardia sp. CDC159]|uniref:SAM-dependent methyltransferase n=1 Tax=Nocardia pulmonis TaxID=2951408 RepID=A0A9X2J0K6_9NOCA|nr:MULTISPECIES: SAM-dependent methyltransferase [Nocardia]MCM6778658.1 SAM-dependent methyltransferase [Nocardia pulmonis]MCM6791547.1 SAM-dependent methyltransferase [Nocardia sp. CDC159]